MADCCGTCTAEVQLVEGVKQWVVVDSGCGPCDSEGTSEGTSAGTTSEHTTGTPDGACECNENVCFRIALPTITASPPHSCSGSLLPGAEYLLQWCPTTTFCPSCSWSNHCQLCSEGSSSPTAQLTLSLPNDGTHQLVITAITKPGDCINVAGYQGTINCTGVATFTRTSQPVGTDFPDTLEIRGEPCQSFCGTAQLFQWNEGPLPSRGWYPLDYNCIAPCVGSPPARDGAYQDEIAIGICN